MKASTSTIPKKTPGFSRFSILLPVLLAFVLCTSTVRAQMSGTYTIGSGGSYASISAAVAGLASNGINGPVTFNVTAGTFTESVSIPAITGASSTNTIVFQGAGRGKTFVQNNSPVITFNSCSWVSFNGFNITNTASSYAVYASVCSNCGVLNCDLKASTSCCIYCVYDNFTYNWSMINNHISGGYFGVYINSSAASSTYANGIYKNNRIVNFGYYGMENYYANANQYINNVIDSSANGYGYGLLSVFESGSVYNGNRIIAPGMYYPALIEYANFYSATATFKVINNVFSNFLDYLYFYNWVGSNILIAHNTVYGNTNYYAMYMYNGNCGSDINLIDNIFYGGGNNPTVYIQVSGTSLPTPFGMMDGNAYVNPGGGAPVYLNGTYSTLAAYQSAMASYTYTSPYNGTKGVFEAFASNTLPTFIKAPSDLHVNQLKIAPFGVYAGVDADMDGDARCKLFPSAGADESNFGKGTPTVLFYLPSLIYPGAPTHIYQSAKEGEPKTHKWFLNGVLVSTATVLFTNKFVTGSNTLELITQTCGGNASYKKTFNVSPPTAVPLSDFIANKNTILQNENVQFTDLSTNGATSWSWDISPATTFSSGVSVPTFSFTGGTGATDQNPQIKFLFGGKYDVCMTAGNGVGKGARLCKTHYINVAPTINLSSGTQTTHEPTGYLFDNGGPNGNYKWDGSNNYIESIIIDPCADSVYLTFSQFDTYCGYDYIRLFEGRDNAGKPLWNSKCSATGWIGLGPGYVGGKATSCSYACMPDVVKPDTFKAKSAMYIQMVCYAASNSAGFAAKWWSKPKTSKKPSAAFTTSGSGDSVCTNQSLNYFNNTKQDPNDPSTFLWDLDGNIADFECVGLCNTTTYPYFLPGDVIVTLVATNCGGSDTFTRIIHVYNPKKPHVDFSADNLTPTTNDVVFFSNQILQCVDDYKWTITKSSGTGAAVFVNGTSRESAAPQVMFSEVGYYDVTLEAENAAGIDSKTITKYIHVRDPYCIPSVGILNAGLGISKVVFNTISNSMTQASQDYSNFAGNPSLSTTVAVGATYKITLSRDPGNIYDPINRTVYIDWNQDGSFTGTGEIVASDSNTFSADFSANIKVPLTAAIGATIMRVAVNYGSYSNKPCGQNELGEYQDYRIYVTPYNIVPVITLKGKQGLSDTIYLEQGYTFIEPGDSASSFLYGNITKDIVLSATPAFSNVVPGNYELNYDLTDKSGNRAETRHRIVKITPDKTPPDLIVDKPDTTYIEVTAKPVHPVPVPAVISSIDLLDGPVPVTIDSGKVQTNIVGTYIVAYNSPDYSGNMATVYRVIKIIDTIPPAMKLIGKNPEIVEVYHPYNEQGVIISDNYNTASELNPDLTITVNVDINKTGTYIVTYQVRDKSGNSAQTITRTVKVVDTIAPVLTLNGPQNDSVDVFKSYTDPGVTVSDNYDKNQDITIVVSGSFYTAFAGGKNSSVTGTYTIIYTATDQSGNKSSITRTVRVLDHEPPVIRLIGDAAVSVCRWFPYVDAGYTVSDNYDKAAKIKVETLGNYTRIGGTTMANLLYLYYKATDQAGNAGYTGYRYIEVKSENDFTCLNAVNNNVNSGNYIQIYPNPSNGVFTVNTNLAATENVSISITNLLGQELSTVYKGISGKGIFNVDLSNQPAGVYLLQLETNSQKITRQIVITR
jgi:PKD repeat protein